MAAAASWLGVAALTRDGRPTAASTPWLAPPRAVAACRAHRRMTVRCGAGPLQPPSSPADTPAAAPPRTRAERSAARMMGLEEPRAETVGSRVGSSPAAEGPPADAATCDRLITLFRGHDRSEWRLLMAASAEWGRLAAPVVARLTDRAGAEPETPAGAAERLALLRLAQSLRATDAEVRSRDALWAEFLDSPPEAWEGMVALRRPAIDGPLLEHAALRSQSRKGEGDTEGEGDDALATAAARVRSLCVAHDAAASSASRVAAAASTFQELLTSGSLAEADARIDALAASGRLDPALVLLAAKAHQSVKESPYTQEDVKDVMVHLYAKMQSTLASQQPPEVRILKHLLAVEDPHERVELLGAAFTPGPEVDTPDAEALVTTPAKMLATVDALLRAYEAQAGAGRAGPPGGAAPNVTAILSQAAQLMQPAVIERMREIEMDIRVRFLNE